MKDYLKTMKQQAVQQQMQEITIVPDKEQFTANVKQIQDYLIMVDLLRYKNGNLINHSNIGQNYGTFGPATVRGMQEALKQGSRVDKDAQTSYEAILTTLKEEGAIDEQGNVIEKKLKTVVATDKFIQSVNSAYKSYKETVAAQVNKKDPDPITPPTVQVTDYNAEFINKLQDLANRLEARGFDIDKYTLAKDTPAKPEAIAEILKSAVNNKGLSDESREFLTPTNNDLKNFIQIQKDLSALNSVNPKDQNAINAINAKTAVLETAKKSFVDNYITNSETLKNAETAPQKKSNLDFEKYLTEYAKTDASKKLIQSVADEYAREDNGQINKNKREKFLKEYFGVDNNNPGGDFAKRLDFIGQFAKQAELDKAILITDEGLKGQPTGSKIDGFYDKLLNERLEIVRLSFAEGLENKGKDLAFTTLDNKTYNISSVKLGSAIKTSSIFPSEVEDEIKEATKSNKKVQDKELPKHNKTYMEYFEEGNVLMAIITLIKDLFGSPKEKQEALQKQEEARVAMEKKTEEDQKKIPPVHQDITLEHENLTYGRYLQEIEQGLDAFKKGQEVKSPAAIRFIAKAYMEYGENIQDSGVGVQKMGCNAFNNYFVTQAEAALETMKQAVKNGGGKSDASAIMDGGKQNYVIPDHLREEYNVILRVRNGADGANNATSADLKQYTEILDISYDNKPTDISSKNIFASVGTKSLGFSLSDRTEYCKTMNGRKSGDKDKRPAFTDKEIFGENDIAGFTEKDVRKAENRAFEFTNTEKLLNEQVEKTFKKYAEYLNPTGHKELIQDLDKMKQIMARDGDQTTDPTFKPELCKIIDHMRQVFKTQSNLKDTAVSITEGLEVTGDLNLLNKTDFSTKPAKNR